MCIAVANVTVVGGEDLPTDEPLLLITNHFSWFEVPLMYIYLPYLGAVWFAAKELGEKRSMRWFTAAFQPILAWRGQVERKALQKALSILDKGGVIGMMPEGGIDPDLQARVQHGETVQGEGQWGRMNAKLIQSRPGAGWMAVKGGVRVLPVAFLGLEQVVANLRQWKRTNVTMIIGKPFGPMSIPPKLKGKEKTEALQQVADKMMREIAKLMPAENRGFYA
jgi:1-acyl-sn-glycerol-3-phosphate acyltransferase